MRHLSWIITIPVALVVISFAASNREAVTLGLWPLTAELSAPLYLPVLLAVLLGFLAGGLTAWFSAHGARRQARARASALTRAERELAQTQMRLAQTEQRLADFTTPPVAAPPEAVPSTATAGEIPSPQPEEIGPGARPAPRGAPSAPG